MRRRVLSLAALLAFTLGLVWPAFARPARAAAARQPVIVIPGIGGSELTAAHAFHLSVDDGHGGAYTHDYAAGEKVWVNVFQAAMLGDDDYFDALKLRPDGQTPVAPELQLDGIYQSTYGDLIDYLQRQGYAEGRDLWIFPFDWRRDIGSSMARLDGFVTAALEAANGNRTDPGSWTIDKVDIVAHSMGGVLGRAYVSDPARARRVDQLITAGSPQLGAAKLLKTLLYGDDLGSTTLGLGLNPDEIKDVVQNMPGALELLPSRSYYSLYDNSDAAHLRPLLEERDADADGVAGGPLAYAGVRALLLNLGTNRAVLSAAERFQSGFDGRRLYLPLAIGGRASAAPAGDTRAGGLNGVRWQALIGYGQATIGQVRVYTGVCGNLPCARREELPIDGDGTVGLFSAAMGDPQRARFFTDAAQRWYLPGTHSGLIQRDYMANIPTGDGAGLQWIGARLSEPATAASAMAPSAPPPAGLNGLWIEALGPVALRVSDAQGHSTGRAPGSDDVAQEIAGSTYDRLADGEFAFVPAGAPVTVALAAERAGNADVKVRMIENGRIARTVVYLGVPLGAASRARLALPAAFGASGPMIQLDANGDGAFEREIESSAVLDERASADTAAPTISALELHATIAGQPAIRWRSTDGGAGLLREWAVLDPGPSARRMANGDLASLPPGRHRLLIVAQDRAGNASSQEFGFTS